MKIGRSDAPISKSEVPSNEEIKTLSAETQQTAKETMERASNAGFYEAVTETRMQQILDEIFNQLIAPATEAVVTDIIPTNFDLITSSLPQGATYVSGTRTITWRPGTTGIIGSSATLTYKIRASASNPGGDNQPTNVSATLNYTDINGVADKEKTFPVPTVNVPAPLTVDAGPDLEVALGNSINIGASLAVSGGYPPYTSYRWTCNTDNSWSSTEMNPQVTPQVETRYTVTVTDSRGCTASDTLVVRIRKGSIELKKIVQVGIGGSYDTQKEFVIHVEGGPEDEVKKWNVFLRHNETKTLRGLKPGTYTISEVVPMDYKLIEISSSSVTITPQNLDHEVTITNKKVNDSWFRDVVEVNNTFTMKLVFETDNSEPESSAPSKVAYEVFEAILPEREEIFGVPEDDE